MSKETIYMLIPTGNEDLSFEILREKPEVVDLTNYQLEEVEVEHTDNVQIFVILDDDLRNAKVHDVVELYTTKASLQEVINLVKTIPDYTGDDLENVIYEIFKYKDVPYASHEVVLF